MAWWGWHGLLAIPAWLVWITGIGYSMAKQCIEGDATTQAAVTASERAACHETPAGWAPTRGLKFGTDTMSGEMWVAGAVLALTFMLLVFWAAVRFARRRSRSPAPEQADVS